MQLAETAPLHSSLGDRAKLHLKKEKKNLGRVNETGSPSDRGLEPWEGRVAYYRHKKEARQEKSGQKSTISLNAAVLALETNNLDIQSRDLI